MDSNRFDGMTRLLAEGKSRRSVLAGLLAGFAGAATLRHSGAQGSPNGTPCTLDTQCSSALCVDGFCCNEICNDDCEACNLAGSEGTCTLQPFGSSGGCAPPGVCDGSGGCCFLTGVVSPPENCCSGFAPQNVCCDTACDGPCETCIADGSFGTCTVIPGCGGCDPGEIDCGEGCVTGDCCGNADCSGTGECGAGVCTDHLCSIIQDSRVCDACGICNENYQCEYCLLGTCCCPDGEICDEACCDHGCENDDDCGACEFCDNGTCHGACSQSEECCNDQCVPLGQCAHLCIPQSHACEGSQLECCVGLMCCIAGDTSFCTECCEDSDCGACEICDSGTCAPVTDCCKDFGDYCGLEVASAGGDGSQQLDCCDGLVCCENWNSQGSVCAQCCNDWDCGKDGYCHEGVCKYPTVCHKDKDCPEHTCCCDDGSCSWHCCDHHHHHHPKPPKPAPPAPTPETPVTTLPATGTAPGQSGSSAAGITLAAGAAALLGAKILRHQREEAEAGNPDSFTKPMATE